MDFNRYFTNQDIDQILPNWAQAYPNLLELRTLGESYEKRPIHLLVITNRQGRPDTDKPAVWVDANIHATEITGTTTALLIAFRLLDGYGKDPAITRLLDTSVYYLVPRLNPDGAALAMADRPQFIRSGVRPYPWQEKDEGLHEEDIDGDGRILQMRIPDPTGDWKISRLDPRLLEKRAPNEWGGEYFRLLPEGRIEDFDGEVIRLARSYQGLDFNRNFPFEWKPEGDQSGAGPYPASEPEIKAVTDFFASHPNINLALTYHTFSRVILRPFSTKSDDDMEVGDLWVFKKIGSIGTKTTGYRNVSTFHDFKYHPKEVTYGAFDDWCYDQWGVYAFTVEQWDLPTEAGIKDRKFIDWFREHPHEEDLQILLWTDANAAADAFVDWYPFDHPQLGDVELGGWNSFYTWRNPPPNFIGPEAERNAPFALALGDLLPRLSIRKLEVTPLGEAENGLRDYQIRLVVENAGFLPTTGSEQGKKRKAVRPVRAELDLPQGVEIRNGKRRVELGHLEGRSNKLDVSSFWDASPTDNRALAEWVLRAPAGTAVRVNVLSERAGSLREVLRLE